MLSSINVEQRLYVIEAGKGYSCLGFDVADKRTRAMAAWLRIPALMPHAPIGTPEAYGEYLACVEACKIRFDETGERCPVELTPQLVGLEGWRVEVVDSYGEKRRFIVGKSTGWIPCHLEIARRNSSGGPAAMGPYDSVKRIQKVR